MAIILRFPTFVWLLLAYNLVMITADATLPMAEVLGRGMCYLPIGKPHLTITLADLFVLVGIVLLFIEICKSTGSSTSTLVEHAFSVVLLLTFLTELFLVERAATSTFLILIMMELLDVVAGFTITVTAARRDMAIWSR